MKDTGGVWERQAAQWQRVGAPLRPTAEDVAWHAAIATELAATTRAPLSILQLGVTPEIAQLPWPERARLLAMDCCADMIERVWPGPRCGVVQADWLAMPLAPASRDLVVSDGCFGVLAYPDAHRALLAAVRNVLRPGGRFVFRVFTQAAARDGAGAREHERPAAIYDDAVAGRIESFHAFKLRLLMAMQPDSTAGVCTGDVWKEFDANAPRPEILGAPQQWPSELIGTIHAYRGQQTKYCFPTLAELRALFEEARLVEMACGFPSYELGDRCPTLVLAAA